MIEPIPKTLAIFLWDKAGQKRMNVKQAVTENKNLRTRRV